MRYFVLVRALFGLAGLIVVPSSAPTADSSGYKVQKPPLDTPWTYMVGTNPWHEYPRPQRARLQWQNLNGIWRYSKADGLDAVDHPPFNSTLDKPVLIPSCVESGLSGVQEVNALYSWFSTSFTVPTNWEDRVLLNFGAVDYEATVFLNEENVAFHRGGYFEFTIDITDYLTKSTNDLLVFVHDPTDSEPYVIPIGKQTLEPSHIFYTPCSGIWQSVWIEHAPEDYITDLHLSADMDGMVSVSLATSSNDTSFETALITMYDRNSSSVQVRRVNANQATNFKIPFPRLWSPQSPNLYDIEIRYGNDTMYSYTGFRTMAKGIVNGVVRPLLNGKPIFQMGTLDQGYWPDGLYTPPNREAMEFDLIALKRLGFNMVRKHIKVETALFYQSCDRLGLIVIQDMPALMDLPDSTQQDEFQRQLAAMIKQLRNYPSIGTWVIYNEGWGQVTSYRPEVDLTDLVRQLDPTRLIDATSGWHDHGAGDYSDNHHYTGPECGTPFFSSPSSPYDSARIGFQGEFGGIGHVVAIEHLWNVQEAIDGIEDTYEISESLSEWNYRSHELLSELRSQTEDYACSGGVWTQTTDVEGEVNGLLTYDRRIARADPGQWRKDIQALYDAAAMRSASDAVNPRPFMAAGPDAES